MGSKAKEAAGGNVRIVWLQRGDGEKEKKTIPSPTSRCLFLAMDACPPQNHCFAREKSSLCPLWADFFVAHAVARKLTLGPSQSGEIRAGTLR